MASDSKYGVLPPGVFPVAFDQIEPCHVEHLFVGVAWTRRHPPCSGRPGEVRASFLGGPNCFRLNQTLPLHRPGWAIFPPHVRAPLGVNWRHLDFHAVDSGVDAVALLAAPEVSAGIPEAAWQDADGGAGGTFERICVRFDQRMPPSGYADDVPWAEWGFRGVSWDLQAPLRLAVSLLWHPPIRLDWDLTGTRGTAYALMAPDWVVRHPHQLQVFLSRKLLPGEHVFALGATIRDAVFGP